MTSSEDAVRLRVDINKAGGRRHLLKTQPQSSVASKNNWRKEAPSEDAARSSVEEIKPAEGGTF